MNEILKEKLKLIPHQSGSYQYKNKNGEIIYVGKAKDLYNRVHSYFVGAHDAKTTKLVSEIYDFDYIITNTENEALILEINLIKKYRPIYNIMLMDDKQYPYIVITNERHPKLIYTRDLNKNKGIVYGPYPNAKAAKEVIEFLNRIVPFRKCYKLPKKECLYYHMGQCLAPCIKDIKKEDYDPLIKEASEILKGKVNNQIKVLKQKMTDASNNLDYEKAIEYRDMLNYLEVISEKQKMEGYREDCDVISYYILDEYLSVQIFHLRDGKVIERNGYLLEKGKEYIEIFQDFVYNFYLVASNPIPKQIFVSDGNIEEFSKILNTHVNIPKMGKNKMLLDLVTENAKNKAYENKRKKENIYKRTVLANIELGKLLGKEIHVIEAFDNSNIQGSSPVSGMVVFVDGVSNKKLYRKYHIKTVIGANDYLTMQEVVKRRYKDIENNPDLIIMDGGQIQVHACIEALKEIDRNIDVLGLVKDDNHKTNALYYHNQIIEIDKHSNLFRYLENIQEEVHRYAISFFRTTHNKNLFNSQIDAIKGIGKVKKERILKLLASDNFEEAIKTIKLNEEQIKEVLRIFKQFQ